MHKKIIIAFIFIVCVREVQGQEIQARLTIVANKVSTQVDKKIFQTLQTALVNFLNN